MKERMLTVLVPIKDSDVTQTYQLLNELRANVTPSIDNINNIYAVGAPVFGYMRTWLNPATNQYEFHQVVDREFPYLGKPLEIFDFTYDATRMGSAPTITAQGIMWYADKDSSGNDVTLEGLWSQECHVSFNGENFYLKQIPTSSKSNEDARYKYDIDFVSERVVLERVYLYDVVQPFVSSKPISESAQFSFYGDITELAKRINASLLRSGLATIALKSGVTPGSYLTYEEFNSVGLGTYTGTKDTSDQYPIVPGEMQSYIHYPHANIYEHFGGNYTKYLLNRVYEVDNPQSYHIGPSDGGYDEIYDGEPRLSGYKCLIGNDKKGVLTTSEEKLITFENNTIHEALQQVHDTFELQYYIYREIDASGNSTGNTIIMIADCQHDFADIEYVLLTSEPADWSTNYSEYYKLVSGAYVALSSAETFATNTYYKKDFNRDSDGIPTTASPFDYGVEDALLSKEKTNTTDKIITRITGVGSEENIPWYYPNPNADGWIKPLYKTDGVEQSVTINYPTSEGTTVADSVRYEKFLKNRVGDVFQFGKKVLSVSKGQAVDYGTTYPMYIDEKGARIGYQFSLSESTRMKVQPFVCDLDGAQVNYTLYKDDVDITSSSNAFMKNGGSGTLEAGKYYILFNISFTSGGPAVTHSVSYYYYPGKSVWCDPWKTWSWRMVLNILTGILSLSAIRTFIASFTGFSASMPAFLSTDPNLRFVDSEDATKVGWYSENGRISKSEMVFGRARASYYVFEGGSGTKTPGVDDCYQATFDTYTESCNLQLLNVDPGNWDDCRQFFVAWSYGDASRRWPSCNSIVEVDVEVAEFIANYITYSFEGYFADGWYKGSKKQVLADWGISNESDLTLNADVSDTIEFQRIKYVTPQPKLMPDVYIKTDGERRFYNAHNYYVNGGLLNGTADPMIGEVQSGSKVKNPLYKEKETDADSKHYVFENEYVQNMPHEHIEEFEDVKPTIKGQLNYIRVYPTSDDFSANPEFYYTVNSSGLYTQCTSQSTYNSSTAYYHPLRIDIVEEFSYDELDNNEVWESNEDGNVSGEYKHPFFYAKLRPLGFNIFDLALQDEMILSMTTGHCGACNFKIGVDENTKKNPVQIWEYDVYGGATYATKGDKIYSAGDLRRYVDTSSLYYDTGGTADGYHLVDSSVSVSSLRTGFIVGDSSSARTRIFDRTTYSASEVANGEVGSLKREPKTHFAGDVKIGKFCDAQQDTSENYVWVALYKDVETYGVIMPSAQPDYGDGNYSHYIDPKGSVYTDRKTRETVELDDDDADKFVLINIRLPQVYLRRAERDLARKIIAYMYDNNFQKFNFSIKFSRIFLAENNPIESNLNENSVLYVTFNNKIYRQYAKHYTYRMVHDASLPEISVEMNEELSVSRTSIEQQAAMQAQTTIGMNRRWRRNLNVEIERVRRATIGINDDVLFSGNLVSRDNVSSFNEISKERISRDVRTYGTSVDLINNHFNKNDFELFNGTDLRIGDKIFLPTAFKNGHHIVRRKWDNTTQQFIDDSTQNFSPAFIDTSGKVSDYAINDKEYHSITPAKQSDLNIVRHTVEQRFIDKGWAISSPTCENSNITTISVDKVQYLFWTNANGENILYQGSGSGQCQRDPF